MICFKCHKKVRKDHGVKFLNQYNQLVVLHKKCQKELEKYGK